MAYMLHTICTECRIQFQYNAYEKIDPLMCNSCTQALEKKKQDAYFAELDELSLEERVRRLEQWLYFYKPRKSLLEETF